MKSKNIISALYGIYDLSNPHFQNAEIITRENKNIKGQFVRFKIAENHNKYILYPSEKYCFLPEDNKKEFWNACQLNNGVFGEKPAYIIELGLNDIKKIIIVPVLIS